MAYEHTPGPWRPFRFLRDHNGIALHGVGVMAEINSRDAIICEAFPRPELVVVSYENMQLAAAAPALLDALNYLLEQTVDQDMAYGIELTEGETEARAQALAAIAAATGQPIEETEPLNACPDCGERYEGEGYYCPPCSAEKIEAGQAPHDVAAGRSY